MKLADRDGAEEVAAGKQAPGPPGGEDDERQRDPAASGGHVLHPLRRIDERELRAGKAGTGAAEHHGKIARADDVDAERMGRGMAVADRTQFQAGAAPEQEPVHAEDQRDRQVEDQVLPEQQRSQERDIGKQRDCNRLQLGARHADIGFADLAGNAEAENGERKTGRHLVGDERQRQETEEQREERAAGDAREDPDIGRARHLRGGEGKHGAHHHHALDAEVQHARAFGDEFAE